MDNLVWTYGSRHYGPEELRELGVAFESCCAAMPDMKSPEFRETLALRLLSWATLGMRDSVQLYMKALDTHRALQRL